MEYCDYCDEECEDREHHYCRSCGAHLVELGPYECEDVDEAMLSQHNPGCASVAPLLEARS